MPAAIARRFVHLRVRAARILSQHCFHPARQLEELGPIERRDGAHAGDGIADRYVIRGLPQVLAAGQLVGRRAQRLTAGGNPIDDRQQRRVVLAHALQELNQEACADVGVAGRKRRQRTPQPLVALGVDNQAVGPLVGQLAVARVRLRASQGADDQRQSEPEHDRHCPQLADRHRGDALISDDVFGQQVQVDARIGVPQVVQAQPIHAWVASHVAARDPRQLNQVAPGQILLNLAELLLDDVRIVEQPLFGWARVTLVFCGARQRGILGVQLRPRSREALAQRPGGAAQDGLAVRSSDLGGVADQVLGRVELTAQRADRVPGDDRRQTWAHGSL